MKISLSSKNNKSDVHILITSKDQKPKGEISKACMKHIDQAYKAKDFTGDEGQSLSLYDEGIDSRVLVLGLGDKNELDNEKHLITGGKAYKHLKKMKVKTVKISLEEEQVRAFTEGFLFESYKFDKYLSKDKKTSKDEVKIQKVEIFCKTKNSKKLQTEINEVENLMESVNYVRDLVNTPASDMHTEHMVKEAKKIAKMSRHIKLTIIDRKKAQKLGMGALYAVGQGANNGPYLILLEYKKNAKNKRPYTYVGKGIVFDTGGLNLKPTKYIEDMFTDMAGAANTLGFFYNLVKQNHDGYYLGVVATAENAIGPDAIHPSDIVKSYSGQTIEITNTDAEGRLVLADALSYVSKKFNPEFIIDMATLTGAAIVALGHEITAMMSTDQKLADTIIKYSKTTDERVWQLPLEKFHIKATKGTKSDLVNWTASMRCGTIMAAAFLSKFVGEGIAWAHLDIAGTAFLDAPHGVYGKGATGVPLRTLWAMAKDL